MKVFSKKKVDRLILNVLVAHKTMIKGDDEYEPELKKILGVIDLQIQETSKESSFSKYKLYEKKGIKIFRGHSFIQIDFMGEFFVVNSKTEQEEIWKKMIGVLQEFEEIVKIKRIDACIDIENLNFLKVFNKNLVLKRNKTPLKLKMKDTSLDLKNIVGGTISNKTWSLVFYDKIHSINETESPKNNILKEQYASKKIWRVEIQYLNLRNKKWIKNKVIQERKSTNEIAELIFDEFKKNHGSAEINSTFNRILSL